jgi:hypothetical protein
MISPFGRCGQPPSAESEVGLCVSHQRWIDRGVTPDPAYEKKIVEGLVQPVDSYLTDTEIEAMLNGRYRGDGRRLDVYCPPEGPLGVNL